MGADAPSCPHRERIYGENEVSDQPAPSYPVTPFTETDGTETGEPIEGTSGNDVITGLGGDDVIRGHDGYDIVVGGYGNDWLEGNTGNDFLIGGRGSDLLDGGDGDDTLMSRSDGGEQRIGQLAVKRQLP